MNRYVKSATCLSAFFIVCGSAGAQNRVIQSQVIGAPPEASNMKLVGYNDLQARSAYQPTIHHQGDRWIAWLWAQALPHRIKNAERQVADLT